ncbi:excinuclease ABC subunit UvrC [Heliophilum fasciatum]|uniref:UvrABC system protein C n=1 Tax=Heliophilum fasciatum TaxID=35700 RepID=A0A4R2RQR3_9FIRM|nr:excinuclease ABC subunit UvrC [Heliophilum fasciatum]MCW2279040.1 excinuclease ABC subunit C [Heliophilum fasciatum]TCP61505.1 excinuclease ABC subunit C [Heliophilum fasciatum]
MNVRLQEKLQHLPEKPGVYLMRDAQGQVIYVGKAIHLKNRVRSYFQAAKNLTAKTQALVSHIDDLETIVTDSELEALILECNLIKQHKPQYNIMLRDDKTYPYIKVNVQERFPRLVITRRLEKDGAKYFGPYPSAGAVKETVQLLRQLFPLRTCSRQMMEQRRRPCLNHHIGRCLAPCSGEVEPGTYRAMIDHILAFLEGKTDELLRRLRAEMMEAAAELDFERAAERRDQIQALEQVLEKQKVFSADQADEDVIAMARGLDQACVQVFFVRGGKLIGREHFFLGGTAEMEPAEILTAFVKQYYSRTDYIPEAILLQAALEPEAEAVLITQFLRNKRGKKVEVRVPKRGDKKQLIDMVAKNALLTLEQTEQDQQRKKSMTEQAVLDLQGYLHLDEVPWRIECYDISNTMGTETVASMVVFEGGAPKNADYRRFRIRTVEGPNDFASMQEVLTRRFSRARAETEEIEAGRLDPMSAKFAVLPDLVIIDGGKGQLSSAREVMHQLGYGGIATFGLAKENEWLFAEGNPEPIILPRHSKALYLVQRIRDEAHRFAITYHRQLRGKAQLVSLLDEVPGIGPKRKTALLRHFGSVTAIAAAPERDVAAVEGMTVELAEQVIAHLRKAQAAQANR